jgi:hypothetical protein
MAEKRRPFRRNSAIDARTGPKAELSRSEQRNSALGASEEASPLLPAFFAPTERFLCGRRENYRRSCATSSPRWRCERPPIVFDGEMRHWVRILFALTRPYFGTARIMSNAFADMT